MTTAVQFVRDLDLVVVDHSWTYAEIHHDAIKAAWARWTAENPDLFNGKVFILTRGGLESGTFRGVYAETDFAAFLYFLRTEADDGTSRNAFGLGALTGADGSLVMGVMGAHTANAGRIYFPGGTPDRHDLINGQVDLGASVTRELTEETGLDPAELAFDAGFVLVSMPKRHAFLKIARSPLDGESLRQVILSRIASQPKSELADIAVIRSVADIDETRMPPFQAAYVRWWFETGLKDSRNAS